MASWYFKKLIDFLFTIWNATVLNFNYNILLLKPLKEKSGNTVIVCMHYGVCKLVCLYKELQMILIRRLPPPIGLPKEISRGKNKETL